MATELDTSTLKSGDSLFFKSAGRFPFWTPEPNPYVMDKIFENVLEGAVHSWGPGTPEQNQYRFKRQWANDADEAPINASKIGGLAGSYLGVMVTDLTDFPFKFYNRDGGNHDQQSTIFAWVKKEDVEIKEDMETRLKNLLGTDPAPIDGQGGNIGGGGTGKSTWTILIAFFAAVGTGLFFLNKKQKDKQALAYQQPQPYAKPIYKNVKL
jgi:hypothetical protein